MATQGGAPKKKFFYENALSGSIHSTYQLPSLQTDQKPTLGQPIIIKSLSHIRTSSYRNAFPRLGLPSPPTILAAP